MAQKEETESLPGQGEATASKPFLPWAQLLCCDKLRPAVVWEQGQQPPAHLAGLGVLLGTPTTQASPTHCPHHQLGRIQ